MENLRTIGVVAITAALMPWAAFAYERHTHEGITQATLQTYEAWKGEIFSSSEEEKIIRGSSAEDDGTRPLQHFYDPINNRGLKVGFEWMSSKYWSQDTEAQANYCDYGMCQKRLGYNDKLFSSPTDFSWDRAVYEYVYGDKERSLEALGHVIHLVQDATVPAHVRNDQHLNHEGFGDPDPYEKYSGKFGRGEILVPQSFATPSFPGVAHAIDASANFTNKNFLSKDTLFERFDLPSKTAMVIRDGFAYHPIYGHKIARVETRINRILGLIKVTEEFHVDDAKSSVAGDYWRVLSREAIQNGIGVIDLFFRDVEKEKETGALKSKNKSAAELNIKNLALNGFPIVKFLYGSSLEQKDVEELVNEGQAGAAALALFEPEPLPIPPEEDSEGEGKVLGVSTEFLEESIEEPVQDVLESDEEHVPETTSLSSETVETNTPPAIVSGTGGSPTPQMQQEESSVTNIPFSILSPLDNSTFATTSITFTGTTTPGYTVLAILGTGSATTTVDASETWTLSLDIPEGAYTLEFAAHDSNGYASATTTRSVTIAILGVPVLSIAECTFSLSPDTCVVPTLEATLTWATTTHAVHYAAGIGCAASGVVTTTNLFWVLSSLTDHATTTATVVACDQFGNESISNEASILAFSMAVNINEIGWSGTDAEPGDEWIELKNQTEYTIDLSRLTLVSADGGLSIPLSGYSIAPGGLFLIERREEATSEPADLVVDFGELSDTGEELLLMYEGPSGSEVLDRTPPVDACGGWCFGVDAPATSMERHFSFGIEGSAPEQWHTNLDVTVNGADALGGSITGTPRAENGPVSIAPPPPIDFPPPSQN